MLALHSPRENFNPFLNRIERLVPLERSEEVRLVRSARGGDAAARDKLVTSHLRLVLWVASKHRRYGFPLDDLVGEGTLGLLEALTRFDPGRGLRLNTYAVHWIRAYIVRYVLRNWRVVRVGSSPRHSLAFFRLHRERTRLEALLGDAQEVDAELSRTIGVRPERMLALEQRWTTHDVSLDAPARDGGEGLSGRLRAEGDPEAAFGDREESVRARTRVARALVGLDARESFIIRRRLMGEVPAPLRHLGAELGLSRERVRQLETRAKAKLRRALEEAA